jgi:hypothetical protein
MGGLSRSLFSLKTAVAGLGLSLLAKSFIDAADAAEQYRVRLNVLLGDQEEANKLFESMSEFASGVSFQYEEIMGSATNLAGVLKGGREEIEQYMPMIADLAAASGISIRDTTSQIIRMYSAGAASADMFREKGVLAMLGFQAGVSVSAEETRKRLLAAWEDPASKFRGASTELAKTWSGMLSMIGDAWFQFRNMVMESGVFDYIKAAVQLFLDFIKQLKEEGRLKEWAEEIATAVIGMLEGIAKGGAIALDAFNGLKLIWMGLKGAFALFVEYSIRGIALIVDWIAELEEKIDSFGKRLTKILKYTPGFAGIGWISEALEDQGVKLEDQGDYLRKQADDWAAIANESADVINVLARQESNYSKVDKLLGKIRAKAEEYRKEAEKTGEARPQAEFTPEVGIADRLGSEIGRIKDLNATALAELADFYDRGTIGLEHYFAERRRILDQNYNEEMARLQELLKATPESDPKKRLKVEERIFKAKQAYRRDEIKLAADRTKEEEVQAQRRLDIEATFLSMRKRLLETDAAGGMEAQFALERAALEAQQAEEIRRLTDLKATEAEIEEAHRAQQLELDKQNADQRLAVQHAVLQGVKSTLGIMQQGFADAYEASGRSIKEFFYLQKAASIANTVIATYESAVSAYKAMAGIPIVGPGLGAIAAGAAVAAGMAKVAVIANQSLAEGGEVLPIGKKRIKLQDGGTVPGYSPSSKADNIPINATAGEYMQPVSAVQYYGVKAMEVIKRKMVPREVLAAYAGNLRYVPPPNPTGSFAAGGSVAAGPSAAQTAEKGGSGRDINVVNVIDPMLMDQYVSTTHGQENILNVLSANAFAVKQIVDSE